MPVIKAELGLFQVQFKDLGGGFGVVPERLDTVDMVVAPGKFASP